MSKDYERVASALAFANEKGERIIYLPIEYAAELLAKLKVDAGRIEYLEQRDRPFTDGYKGGCHTCEPVGELNVALEKRLTAHEATIAELREQVADYKLRLGDPLDVEPDTGNPEADRVIAALASPDPEFDTLTDAAVLIRRLVADARAPNGHESWKDAAIKTRVENATLREQLARKPVRVGYVAEQTAKELIRGHEVGTGIIRYIDFQHNNLTPTPIYIDPPAQEQAT